MNDQPINSVSAGNSPEVGGSLVITFGKAMDKTVGTVNLTDGIATLALSGGTWSEDGKTYTVSYSELAYDMEYTVRISDFKTKSDGTVLSADDTHTFKTKADANALKGTATITGDAAVGKTLTATAKDGNSSGTLSYQWTRDGKNITGSTYTLTEDDKGKKIAVKITTNDKKGTQTSASTSAVADADSTGSAVAPVLSEKTSASITIAAKEGYEYTIVNRNVAVSTGTWQDSNKFIGLTAGTEYDVYQRIKKTQTEDSSAPSEVLTVKTKFTVTYNWNYAGMMQSYTKNDAILYQE